MSADIKWGMIRMLDSASLDLMVECMISALYCPNSCFFLNGGESFKGWMDGFFHPSNNFSHYSMVKMSIVFNCNMLSDILDLNNI